MNAMKFGEEPGLRHAGLGVVPVRSKEQEVRSKEEEVRSQKVEVRRKKVEVRRKKGLGRRDAGAPSGVPESAVI